jgi:hypothetical protein
MFARMTATSGVVSPEAVATPSRAGRQRPHVNEPMVDRDSPARNAQAGTAGPVEKAREFIRKVGRPKVPRTKLELTTLRREYMRRYRADKRAKVLADGTRPPEVKSGSE